MTDVFFSDEIESENNQLKIELKKETVGDKIMVIYTDIFGNDLTESFSL